MSPLSLKSKDLSLSKVFVFLFTIALFSHTANAEPLLKDDAVFTQSTLIGTVFFDANLNGYFDEGEDGIPAVRLATVDGLVIETDGYGRFNIPDGLLLSSSHSKNQLIKVDSFSLPVGSRFTTENPRAIKMTNVGLNKFNFGVVF